MRRAPRPQRAARPRLCFPGRIRSRACPLARGGRAPEGAGTSRSRGTVRGRLQRDRCRAIRASQSRAFSRALGRPGPPPTSGPDAGLQSRRCPGECRCRTRQRLVVSLGKTAGGHSTQCGTLPATSFDADADQGSALNHHLRAIAARSAWSAATPRLHQHDSSILMRFCERLPAFAPEIIGIASS